VAILLGEDYSIQSFIQCLEPGLSSGDLPVILDQLHVLWFVQRGSDVCPDHSIILRKFRGLALEGVNPGRKIGSTYHLECRSMQWYASSCRDTTLPDSLAET
jgi:hypothetical protein